MNKVIKTIETLLSVMRVFEYGRSFLIGTGAALVGIPVLAFWMIVIEVNGLARNGLLYENIRILVDLPATQVNEGIGILASAALLGMGYLLLGITLLHAAVTIVGRVRERMSDELGS